MTNELPKVFRDWLKENTDSPMYNHSRDIMKKKITFCYNKFQEGHNEYWARQIEDMTGICADYTNSDPLWI